MALVGAFSVQLISHASVLIEAAGVGILTDPWLMGKAFNDSWSLFPPAVSDLSFLDRVQYVWISHEHPDHFHPQSLRALPADFKERVTILFQRNNSAKMFDALRKMGFKKFIEMPHRKITRAIPGVELYCYQVGQMDSMLGLRCDGETMLNVNDCEINTADCERVRADFGVCDLVLNQFSIAGYGGFADRGAYLPKQAASVLDSMISNHRDLGASVSVPFASFVYFSCEDNRYMNRYSNTPQTTLERFDREGLALAVLYPGDTYRSGQAVDNCPALDRFAADYRRLDDAPYDVASPVPFETLSKQFANFSGMLQDRFTGSVLRLLKPVVVRIPDLGQTVQFCLAARTIIEVNTVDVDLEMNSQPLSFGFSTPFGFQTLGVSARYTLYRNFPNWRNHRILFAMNNAEVYLRPKYLFTKKNIQWIAARLPGAANQLRYRMARMAA